MEIEWTWIADWVSDTENAVMLGAVVVLVSIYVSFLLSSAATHHKRARLSRRRASTIEQRQRWQTLGA